MLTSCSSFSIEYVLKCVILLIQINVRLLHFSTVLCILIRNTFFAKMLCGNLGERQ